MKKVVLTALFAVAGLVGVSAQTTGVEAGVHVGIPVGDTSDVSSFNIGLDLAYLHPVANNFKLGIATGYDHFIGKDLKVGGNKVGKVDDFGFIPLAASAKLGLGDNFFVGADLGYAFATNDDWKGGFYYQPKVGYSASTFDIYAAYKGINSKLDAKFTDIDAAADAVAIGFAYKF